MPVVDQVANDYLDEVSFLAVAGRSDYATSAAIAPDLFSNNIAWGYDDKIWQLYNIPGQPASVLIKDGVVFDAWFGALGEADLREKLDSVTS